MRATIFASAMTCLAGGLFCVGCSQYGDGTLGEEHRSTWRIDDGLCPGTEGGCAMTIPVAAGIDMEVDAEIPCAHPERDSRTGERTTTCDLMDFDVRITGAESRNVGYATSDGRLDLSLSTSEPGSVTFDLVRTGAHYDRVSMEVREAVDIECGRIGSSDDWDMRGLSLESSYAIELVGAEAESKVELGCRLVDIDGEPLFSGSAIQWRIVEGDEIANVDDGGLFGTDSTTGARVYVHVQRRGTIVLEGRFGDFARQVSIVAD